MPTEIVYDLASILKLSDNAFIVGGQALNLWAEHYSEVAELQAFGPYTSKDLDYFGRQDAARKLADALNGTLHIPNRSDHTPQTAVVKATINGREIEIDFLWHVLGVDDERLVKQAEQLKLTVRIGSQIGLLLLPIMHPLHCMQSRIANVVELKRRSELSIRQMEASPIVLREYLSERLNTGGQKHVIGVLQVLFHYLKSDINGRKAHKHMNNDPADVLTAFQDDPRLDERWRDKSLRSMRDTLTTKRQAWLTRMLRGVL